jgi:phage I-like protein
VAVVSVALCRNGAVPGAEFRESTLHSTTTGGQAPRTPSNENPQQHPHKENAMDYKAILLKLLGLPEDASDEAVADAVEKLNQAKAPEPAPEPNPAGGVAPLAARIDALERRADKAEKDAILARARAEGRVVALSAEAVAKLSPQDLEETVAKTPATVPLSAVTPGAVREKAPKAEESEEERRVREMCGLTREEVEKWA